jgi:hypothetical protein
MNVISNVSALIVLSINNLEPIHFQKFDYLALRLHLRGRCGEKVMTSYTDVPCLPDGFCHTLNGESLGSFNVHLEKVDLSDSSLATNLIQRDPIDREGRRPRSSRDRVTLIVSAVAYIELPSRTRDRTLTGADVVQ